MNKLSLALCAAFSVCTLNIASAQMGNTGGANPAMGAEMKHEQASEPGDTSGTAAPESGKKGMHKDGMHKGGMEMKAMDTNKDGMISKEEFMTSHEAMYDGMKKNKDGMVDVKEMRRMHERMAK